jgi:hypothetical protein
MFGNQPLETKLTSLAEQIRSDFTLLEGRHESGRRASNRARLVLRRLNGSLRRSSPSSARQSNAYN